jgi:hypothetical protein
VVGRKKLKEDCQSPVHLLHSKLKVLHSLTEFEDQVMQDGEVFARRVEGRRLPLCALVAHGQASQWVISLRPNPAPEEGRSTWRWRGREGDAMRGSGWCR